MELNRWQRLRTRVYLFATGIRRRMTLGARAVPVDGNKVFLIRQTYIPGWHFCGGGVEPGESCEYASAREMEEETGYRPIGPMQFFGFYHNVGPVSNRDHIALFICRQFEQTKAFQPNFEVADAGWFSIDDLPEGTSAATRRRIDEIFRGRAISPTW